MITTVTMNPCIDRTLEVEKMEIGGTNRVIYARNDIGGKGINAAIALKHLGITGRCIGINYSDNWKSVEQFLSKQKVAYKFTICQGNMRINTKIFERKDGTMTEFNERGAHVGQDTLQHFMEIFDESLNNSEMLILNGSVPPGIPADIYRKMIKKAARCSVRTILDASGEQLREGVKAAPFIIKPNLAELSETVGRKLDDRGQIVKAAQELVGQGTSYVCISMGAEGALLVGEEGVYESLPLKLDVRGVQGAGDSMVAGICLAVMEKKGPEDMLRYGTAAASASLQLDGTQLCSREDFDRLLPKCVINRIK